MTSIASRTVRGLPGIAIGALAVALAQGAVAQTAAPAAAAAPAEAAPAANVEDIIVTGSRIRGVSAVGSNVIAIDQSKIAAEPVTSTADLLRRVPQVIGLGQNRNGGTAQNAGANATRGAGINLRGIGTNATLILADGKRLPAQGTQGQYTDPSVLPSIALSRVEVVADGASAIYGSDAVAGVVNFIMRKNFDGAEFRLRSGFTGGTYGEQQAAGIFGKTWNGGYATLSGEYTHNSALRASDLPWYQDDNRYRGGRDLRITNCAPSTITAGGRTYAIPQGGVTSANVGSLVAGTSNRCFYNAYDYVIPSQTRTSVLANVSQDIGESLRVFGDGFYSRRHGKLANNNTTFTATVTRANPFFVTPVAGGTSVTVPYSLVPELGSDIFPYRAYSWATSGGVEAKLFSDWTGTAYYSHGESYDISDRRTGESYDISDRRTGVNAAALAAALLDTNRATALNVFGGPNNPATLARIHDNYFQIIGKNRLDVANLQLSGTLVELPGGKLKLAVGAEYRKEYTFTDLVSGNSTAQIHTADSGSRNVKALFGELYIPVFGGANAVPGLQELSFSLAGRYEDYSNFGSTSNPKVGVTWRPVRGVTIRGSYGTSFRAPTFTEISTIAGGAGLYFDTLPGAAGNQMGIGIAGGNPDLKPESATTWSGGIEFKPMFAPGLTLTGTYWNIDYKDQIQALRGTSGILTNPLYASFVTLNPTPAQVQALIASGLPINQAINASAVTFIVDGRRQNLGRSKVSGIDFGANYRMSIGDLQLDGGVQGTYYTRYKFQAVPGAALAEVIGTINFPQRFRMQADLGAALGKVKGRVTLNHLSAYDNTGITPVQRVGDYDTIDASVSVDITEQLSLSVDVRNLLNEDPPFVDQTRGYDPQSTNPVPRLVSVTAGIKF